MCLVAPYPFRVEPLEDFDHVADMDITGGGDVWYARPLLFFKCTLCPTGRVHDTTTHMVFSLVFFSTFEPIRLTLDSCMQKKGVPMLYERAAKRLLIQAISRPDSGTGSRLFEVNVWMWRYGRTFPREITVEQAVELRKKRVQESTAGHEALKLCGAGMLRPWPLRHESEMNLREIGILPQVF